MIIRNHNYNAVHVKVINYLLCSLESLTKRKIINLEFPDAIQHANSSLRAKQYAFFDGVQFKTTALMLVRDKGFNILRLYNFKVVDIAKYVIKKPF